MGALNLVSASGFALWLESRDGLPASVEVRVAAANPWFSGCPEATVEMWDPGTGGAPSRLLDRKTFRLRDPVDGPDGPLDCTETTTLLLGGHTGRVAFILYDEDGAEIGASSPVQLTTLPPGSTVEEEQDADEEEFDVTDPRTWDEAAGRLFGGVKTLLTLAVVGVGLYAAAPLLRELVDDDDHDS